MVTIASLCIMDLLLQGLLSLLRNWKRKLELKYPLHLSMCRVYLLTYYMCHIVCIFSSRTSWVKTHGQEYKINTGVIYDVEHDLPLVGKIEDIWIVDGCKVIFNVKLYFTHYQPHFRAYLLNERTDIQKKFLYLSNLFIDTPVHIRTSQVLGVEIFILLPYALCTL